MALAVGLAPPPSEAAGPSKTADPAAAAAPSLPDAPPLAYKVQVGDTLIGIGRRLLEQPRKWVIIQRLNGVDDPYHLMPESTLTIPFNLLKGQPDLATVVSAEPTSGIDGVAAVPGAVVREGSTITTSADSVVVLRLSDGSILRLEPASRLRVERLRRYHDERAVEARVLLEQGRVETTAATERRKPLSVRTPVATAAVRGTRFRVATDRQNASAEVLEGKVDWGLDAGARSAASAARRALSTAGKGHVLVVNGYGARVDYQGLSPPEVLLPAPDLTPLPSVIDRASEDLPFPPVTGASRYRVDISRDPQALTQLSSRVVDRPDVPLVSAEDGLHYVTVRPIAASEVEGQSARATVDVRARPFPPTGSQPADRSVVFGDRVNVQWTRPDNIGRFRLEVAADASFATPLSSVQLDDTSASVALQASGDQPLERFWRVASIDTQGKVGPFSAHPLQWRPTVSQALVSPSGHNRMDLSWAGQPTTLYAIELADNPQFRSPQRIEVQGNRAVLKDLAPGPYFLRLQSVGPDGISSPFSPTQSFEIQPVVFSGSGTPLQSGNGGVIQVTPSR